MRKLTLFAILALMLVPGVARGSMDMSCYRRQHKIYYESHCKYESEVRSRSLCADRLAREYCKDKR